MKKLRLRVVGVREAIVPSLTSGKADSPSLRPQGWRTRKELSVKTLSFLP